MGNKPICQNICTNPLQSSINRQQLSELPKINKLKPILFKQFGSQNKQQTIQKNQIKQNTSHLSINSKNKINLSQQNKKVTFASEQKDAELNIQQIDIQFIKNKNASQIHVPMNIVSYLLSEQLKKTIQWFGGNTFVHSKKQQTNYNWKLTKKGGYMIKMQGQKYSLLKQKEYYEGQIFIQQQSCKPHKEGKLFTQNGLYQGGFENGLANGKGVYEDRKTKTTYEGIWVKGQLVKGTISNEQFDFKGDLQNGKPSGLGQIKFKKKKVHYLGGFKQGKYDAQSARYESQDYIYNGGFKEGRKSGDGILNEKQKNFSKAKQKQKYKPQRQYIGQFQKDGFKKRKQIEV